MILPSWLRGYAAALRGDEGLRAVARRVPPDLLTLVSMRSAEADVDTPLDLARARRRRMGAPQDRGVCTSR
jgi:CTP:molybdopterin cytidylyltransferase MocA